MEYKVQGPDGVQHVIDGPAGASDDEVIQQAQKLFSPSAVESFGRAAVNNLPAGGQLGALGTAALKGEDYSQGMQDFNEKASEAKAEHPVAYGAGAVTGSVAPLAIPGVGEAMAAAPALTGAGLGAANAIGNTDLVKNPDEALKQAALGAGTGAIIGKALPNGEGLASDLEKSGQRQAFQAMGMNPEYAGHLDPDEIQDIGKFAQDYDLVKGTPFERLEKAQNLQTAFGQKIGELGDQAIPGEAIDTSDLQSQVQKWGGLAGTQPRALTRDYAAGIKNIQSLGEHPTFDQIQRLKQMYGQMAFDGAHQVKNQAAADIYSKLKDAATDLVGQQTDDVQDLFNGYKNSGDMVRGLQKMAGKEAATGQGASQGIGFAGRILGKLPGQSNPVVNTATAAGVGMMGHPLMGLMAATPTVMNPAILSQASQMGAEALPKAAQGIKLGTNNAVTSYLLNTLNQNPQKLGRFAQPLINAAKEGGSQGLAAQHFLLSGQYPEYNSMVMGQDGGDNADR
jgi:hypothetical protein